MALSVCQAGVLSKQLNVYIIMQRTPAMMRRSLHNGAKDLGENIMQSPQLGRQIHVR